MSYLFVRMCTSLVTGMILSQTGSLSQLITRNMLASPSTLGVDGLAILWPILLFFLSVMFDLDILTGQMFWLGFPVFFMLGFLFSTLLNDRNRIDVIIFLGITFNLFVGAIFSLLQFLSMAFNYPFPTELLFGHFKYADEKYLIYLLVFESLLFLFLSKYLRQLTLLSLGLNFAKSWNVPLNKLFGISLLFISLGTFLVISLFGAFSFLGLIFPIIARKMLFRKWDLAGEFMYGSFLNGLVFMTLDWICFQFPIRGAEVPVGLLVTAVGSFCLIVLVWRSGLRERLSKPEK